MELWKPPPPRVPVLTRIGRAFRSALTFEAPIALARRAFTCPLCDTPAAPGAREWSAHYGRYVDTGCIPSIVRAAGRAAVVEWLESGELTGGMGGEGVTESWACSNRWRCQNAGKNNQALMDKRYNYQAIKRRGFRGRF